MSPIGVATPGATAPARGLCQGTLPSVLAVLKSLTMLSTVSIPLDPSTAFAQGGPPLLTDDPGTPGDNRWEINLAFALERRGEEASYEAPILDLNYGVGERIQLKLEAPWIFTEREGEGGRNGLGNSAIGVKWRFLDQAEDLLDLSVYPQLEFNNPTSSHRRGLAEEGSELLLPIQLEKSFAGFSFNPEAGIVLRESEDGWVYGLAAGYEASSALELLGELHGEAESDFGDDELVFQLGLRWQLHPHLTLLAAAGRGLRRSNEGLAELLAYAGVQLLF